VISPERGSWWRGLDLTEKGADWFYKAPLHALGTAVLADLALTGLTWAADQARALVSALRSVDQGSADLPAHLAQCEAELTRAERRNDPLAWERAALLWVRFPQPYDVAYCRWRQGEARATLGDMERAQECLRAAWGTAVELRAEPPRKRIEPALSSF
jgi:hypothetical protein